MEYLKLDPIFTEISFGPALVLTERGFVYNGETITDAGAAYKAFMDYFQNPVLWEE